jgi:tetratricopeptide (TPR) repeat protein
LKGMINQASKVKTSVVASLLGLLVPFSVFAGDFLNVLFVVFKQAVPSTILFILFRFAGVLAGGFFLSILLDMIKPSAWELQEQSLPVEMNANKGPNDSKAGKSGSNLPYLTIMINFLASVIILELVKILLNSPGAAQSGTDAIITILPILLVILLAILLNVIFLSASWIIADSRTGIGKYPAVILHSIQQCFKHPAYLAVMLFLWTFTATAAFSLYSWLWKFISGSSMSALLSSFYLGAMICCIVEAVLIFSLKLAKTTFKEAVPADAATGVPGDPSVELSGTPAVIPDGKGNAVAGGILALLLLSAAVYCIMPPTGNVVDQINNNINMHASQAEQYRNKENLFLCGAEYKRAFALTQAMQSYLYNLELYRDKNLSDERRTELTNLSNQSMTTAYEFYPNSSEILFIDGIRSLNQPNAADAAAKLENAAAIKPVFQEVNTALLDLYGKSQERQKTAGVIDNLIKTGNPVQPGALDKITATASKKLLQEYEENSKTYMENITAIAMDYYENQLYPEAMNILTQIQKYSPDAVEVNYLIAMTDLEIKTDGKRYDTAIEACRKIVSQYPDEAWAKDLLTGVTIRAGNQEAMDQIIQTAYQENPDNPDTAEQYAYSLLRKTGSFDLTETDKTAETVIDKVLKKADDRWFSYYCKSLIDLKKRSFETSVSAFEKFSDLVEGDETLFAEYDDMYNQYILKYSYLMKINTAGAADYIKTTEGDDPFLYQYILGAYYWSVKDFENGRKFMESAVNLHPELSKPYFLLGDVYFEEGFRKKNNDYYLHAETNYKKALSIFQEDPYAWFSLGHVLRTMERYEEALGAFQKTLSYMPAEDHTSDHFGVSVHAAMQVQELKTILDQKGGAVK